MNIRSREWQTWVLPLSVAFVLTSIAVILVLPTHSHPLLLKDLVVRSAGMIMLAVFVTIACILPIRSLIKEYFGHIPEELVACGTSAVIWLPLLFVLQAEHALWVIVAPLPTVVIVTRHTRRYIASLNSANVNPHMNSVAASALFGSVGGVQPKGIATSTVLGALLLQAGIAAAVLRETPIAEFLLILPTVGLVWNFTPEEPPTKKAALLRACGGFASVISCFLLTCLALTPFLLAGPASRILGSVVLAGARISAHTSRPSIAGAAYSGVVLLAPSLPKRKHLDLPKHNLQSGSTASGRPLVIPFDGAYLFFEAPYTRPESDAPVQRGDPVKNLVRATDRFPLKMEAHQRLEERISASCCSSLEVHLTNADTRLGVVSVEIVLRDVWPNRTVSQSLGTVPIHSSEARAISLNRPAIRETLRYPMSSAKDLRFNEITLIFKQDNGRNRANAHVRIDDFTLVP